MGPKVQLTHAAARLITCWRICSLFASVWAVWGTGWTRRSGASPPPRTHWGFVVFRCFCSRVVVIRFSLPLGNLVRGALYLPVSVATLPCICNVVEAVGTWRTGSFFNMPPLSRAVRHNISGKVFFVFPVSPSPPPGLVLTKVPVLRWR